jgi:ketosteroid isomerase-like protein
MIKKILFAGLFICAPFLVSADEPDQAIHEELRAVLKVVSTAINSGDFDKMLPVLSEQIRATPINQEFLGSRAEVSAYFKKWFGESGYLKKLEISFTPDALTELSADKTSGIVRGSGLEKYILRDGRPYELHTRWTATMAKEGDGHWRVRAIHIGTNFLDNPILTEAEHGLGKAGGAGLAGGLLLGGALGWFIGRRKKKV